VRHKHTGARYRGINILLLWIRQQERGFTSGLWATYRQWQEAGAQVRKGEKGTSIVFWKTIDVEPQGDDEEAETRMFARYSTVFNAAQVDGFEMPIPQARADITLNESCTEFVQATGAVIEHGHPMACYNVTHDKIKMPAPRAWTRPLWRNTASPSLTGMRWKHSATVPAEIFCSNSARVTPRLRPT